MDQETNTKVSSLRPKSAAKTKKVQGHSDIGTSSRKHPWHKQARLLAQIIPGV